MINHCCPMSILPHLHNGRSHFRRGNFTLWNLPPGVHPRRPGTTSRNSIASFTEPMVCIKSDMASLMRGQSLVCTSSLLQGLAPLKWVFSCWIHNHTQISSLILNPIHAPITSTPLAPPTNHLGLKSWSMPLPWILQFYVALLNLKMTSSCGSPLWQVWSMDH